MTSKSEELDVTKAFDLNTTFLNFGALWYIDDKRSRFMKFLYYLYRYIIYIIFFIYNITTFLQPVLVEEPMDEYVESLALAICEVLHCSKFLCLICYKEKIKQFMKFLVNNFNVQGKPLPEDENKIIQNNYSMARKITLAYYSSLWTTVSVMIVAPPTMFLVAYLNDQPPTKLLIWKIWLPFDYAVFPNNVVVYCFQIVSTIITGCFVIGASNSLFMSLLMFTSCQYELLCASMRSAVHSVNSGDTVSYVRNCINYHQKLLK